LKLVGDQKAVIRLNVIKPLFKEACDAVSDPMRAEELATSRAALEAEWDEFQSEEERKADVYVL
jgi:hypothetical protein